MTRVDFDALSPAEKILHVQDLWDRIACAQEVDVTPQQRADLDRRLDAYRADPTRGSPWEQVRDRLRSKR